MMRLERGYLRWASTTELQRLSLRLRDHRHRRIDESKRPAQAAVIAAGNVKGLLISKREIAYHQVVDGNSERP